MIPLLDVPGSYPWTREDARALHRALTDSFPTLEAVLMIATTVGIKQSELKTQLEVYYIWRGVLEAAKARKKLEILLQQARTFPSSEEQASLIDAVLQREPPVLSAEPLSPTGDVTFVAGTSSISQNESLLFKSDLTISMGQAERLIDTLKILLDRARCVCRLRILGVGPDGEFTKMGTGFRIGPELVLTNHHVLVPEVGKLTRLEAQFGYEHDRAGKELSPPSLDADVASIIADKDNDWGVVRVPGMSADVPSLSLTDVAEPIEGSGAFIIQHPLGNPKRLGVVRNTIVGYDKHEKAERRAVHYLTDTQQGSSGSPVFDEYGRLVAVHHRGGNPVTLAGQLPCRKNEGILISRIAADLAARGVDYASRK